MEHTTIAVDLAKSVFQVAVSHRSRPGERASIGCGGARCCRSLRSSRPPRCCSRRVAAPITGRGELQRLGHTPRLLPAHDVHRYVRRNKTDRADTKALLEADRNDEIHAVPVKSIEQQAIASLHVCRATWMSTRTARLNALRGLCREFGLCIPVGATRVIPAVRAQLTAGARCRCCCTPRWRRCVRKSSSWKRRSSRPSSNWPPSPSRCPT